jgi:hypothetical protein
VLAKVNPLIVKQDTAMRNAITTEARIAVTLRSLATGRSCEDLKSAVWIREPGSGPPSHVRANSEPSWTRPSPARGAPHTDEFGSLGPEPSRTRESDSYVYGHLKGLPARKVDNLTAICEPIVYKIWESRHLTALWASTACYTDTFAFFYLLR